jgi:low temperature requirement protein LtrA
MAAATAQSEAETAQRVSSLELFFDLVFVFTITQLTEVLAHEPTWRGLLRVALMLAVIYWMYGGYAWLTNSVSVDRLTRRLTLLGGMASFFVVALAVPEAFAGSGTAFGLAYAGVVIIHLAMFARASRVSVARAIRGLVPYNLAAAALVLAGGVSGGTAQYVLWAAAVLVQWVSPKLIPLSSFVVAPGHFVERHGLVVLIAIGESVVDVGGGAADLPVDLQLVAAALLGLALSACLWWSYFGTDDDAAEAALEATAVTERPRLAIYAYGYWHLPILLGIVGIAFALKTVTGHAFDALPAAQAIGLGAGASLFLAGEAMYRRSLGLAGVDVRLATAALALATIPIGHWASAALQLVALVALFVAMLARVPS